MKDYLAIMISATIALLYRVLVEFGVMEIDSFTFLVFVPIIIGFIPFWFQKEMRLFKVILYPMLSVLLFLIIAFFMRLEDLGCFIILLPPYFLISMTVSVIIYFVKKKSRKDQLKVYLSPILIVPIFSGIIEKNIQEKETTYEVSNQVIITKSSVEVWNNLLNVPELTNYIDKTVYNYLGFPNPVKSEYFEESNIRVGYFSSEVKLYEKVSKIDSLKEVSFTINIDKSNLESSQTIKHALNSKNITFNSITYRLTEVENNIVKLELACEYKLSSNLPYYGEFWSKKIINDFEIKLLNALKNKIETTSQH